MERVHVQNAPERNLEGMWLRNYKLDDPSVYYTTRASKLWSSISSRLTGESELERRPDYKDCSNEFENYNSFVKWCLSQEQFLNKDNNGKFWHLDKDIVKPFNKVYCEEFCSFVPCSINSLFTWRTKRRGEYPIGVCLDYSNGKQYEPKFTGRCFINGKSRTLGRRSTPMEAHKLWQDAKVKEIRERACQYPISKNTFDGMMLHADLIYDDMINNRETVR